jgi:hypothetical protein
MSTIVVVWICYNPFLNLQTGCLYSKQTSSRTLKSHPLSKNCCSFSSLHRLFITASWEKMQIKPTTYYTYGSKKKRTQTFPYCNYGNKKKRTHPHHLLYLWQHQKIDNYWIHFIIDIINDYHNNSKVVKGR